GPVVIGAELDGRQLVVAGVLIAQTELPLHVEAPAPDAGVLQQRARELEGRAHVDGLRGQRDLPRIGARRAIAGAELAVPVAAPAPDAAVGCQRAGVVSAR